MSKKNDDEPKPFDCTEYCKMTSTIRESEYCTKKSEIRNGKIFFGCMEKLRQESEPVQQYYKCLLWDMGMEDSCNTCLLKCVNNKNKKMEKSLKKKQELDKLIKKLEPNMILYGITSDEVQKISDRYANSQSGDDSELGAEAIAAANIAQKTLAMAFSGKPVDIAYFGLYAEQSSKSIKKIMRKKNKAKKK